MPTYEFGCVCGLTFERRLSVSKANDPYLCPNCGVLAERMISSTTCTYSFGTDGTINPQNTGFNGVDIECDRIIGEDAKVKWEAEEKRRSVKREIMAREGVDKTDLAVGLNGEYRVMGSDEKKFTRTIRGTSNAMIHNHYKERLDSERKRIESLSKEEKEKEAKSVLESMTR